jgi:hypothetical protein
MDTVAGVLGFGAVPAGSWAYGALEEGTTPIGLVLRSCVLGIIAGLLGIDLVYRIPKIIGAAMREYSMQMEGTSWPTEC